MHQSADSTPASPVVDARLGSNVKDPGYSVLEVTHGSHREASHDATRGGKHSALHVVGDQRAVQGPSCIGR